MYIYIYIYIYLFDAYSASYSCDNRNDKIVT